MTIVINVQTPLTYKSVLPAQKKRLGSLLHITLKIKEHIFIFNFIEEW